MHNPVFNVPHYIIMHALFKFVKNFWVFLRFHRNAFIYWRFEKEKSVPFSGLKYEVAPEWLAALSFPFKKTWN